MFVGVLIEGFKFKTGSFFGIRLLMEIIIDVVGAEALILLLVFICKDEERNSILFKYDSCC